MTDHARPVVVGIDGTAAGLEALAAGRELAALLGAPLVLGAVCGWETGGRVIGGFVWPIESEAGRWLAEAAETSGETEATRKVMLSTSPAHGLVALAESTHAQLLVLGSSHHNAWDRLFGGSTVRGVVHGAPCAVAVIPRGGKRLAGDFAAGVTEGAESLEALAFAARLAAAAGAPLRVFTAVHVASPANPMFAATGTSYHEWREARRRCAQRVAHEAIAAVAPGAGVTTAVMEGDPVARLGEASGEVGLLVVGSRRYGPLRSVLLGSVSGGLLERAACPLIVVPRGVDAAQPDGRARPSAQAR